MAPIILPFGPGGGVGEGERDLTFEEIKHEAKRLWGQRGNVFVLSARRDLGIDKVFVVGEFETMNDRHLPPAQRKQKIWGRGDSYAEAFRRARERMARGGRPIDMRRVMPAGMNPNLAGHGGGGE